MPLKDKVRRSFLIASASASMGLGAASINDTPAETPIPITQSATQASLPNEATEPSILDQIKSNQRIEYNGLYFDMPLFRKKQKTNPTLQAFDFHFKENETGIIFKEAGKDYLILMPPQKLEQLIAAIIAKDQGTAKSDTTTTPSKDPREFIFQSNYPDFLIEEKGGRRAMTNAEMGTVFDKTLDLITECNTENIIDVQAIAKRYAQKIGGLTGNSLSIALNAAAFKWTQNKLVRNFAGDYKTDVVASFAEIPTLRVEEEKEFEAIRAKQIVLYDRQQAEQRILDEKEAIRQASLVHIRETNLTLGIEKISNPMPQTILSLESDNYYIEILNIQNGRMLSSLQKRTEDGKYDLTQRELEPEEWRDIHQVLNMCLNPTQKEQLGSDFSTKLEEKFSTLGVSFDEKLTPEKKEPTGYNLKRFLKEKQEIASNKPKINPMNLASLYMKRDGKGS